MTSSDNTTARRIAKVLVAWANLFLVAFVAMFVVGGMHDHADSRVPDLGYWGAFFVVWALALGGRLVRTGLIQEDIDGN